MLDPMLYKIFYDLGRKNKNSIFLEIGGAHGAVSISVALGIKKNNGNGKIIVFEKCFDGSRSRYGNYNDNYKILTNNLKSYEVEKHINLIPEVLSDESYIKAKKILNNKKIDFLIIDADGLLHRDFSYFYENVENDGYIIIDDYDHTKQEKKKKWITCRIVDIFLKHNLVKKNYSFKDTLFMKKSSNTNWTSNIYTDCQKIIDEAIVKFK